MTFHRLMEKITFEPNTGCWLWTAASCDKGYGCFGYNNKVQKAHRVTYQVFKGHIPEKYHIDHLCRTPSCVNPSHLEAVTHLENVRRGRVSEAKKTKICPRGHDLTLPNSTYPVTRKVKEYIRFTKTCRLCDLARRKK